MGECLLVISRSSNVWRELRPTKAGELGFHFTRFEQLSKIKDTDLCSDANMYAVTFISDVLASCNLWLIKNCVLMTTAREEEGFVRLL